MRFEDPALPANFWEKVMPIPFPVGPTGSGVLWTGCWLWMGSTTSKGYGSFRIGVKRGRQVTGMAHKMTYEVVHGRLPRRRGKRRIVIDHRCRTRCCCNPEHLQHVLEPVNVRRGVSPAAKNASKTHCPKGHEYTTENTYTLRIKRDGHDTTKRYCRACRRKGPPISIES